VNAIKAVTKIFLAGIVFGAGTTYGAEIAQKFSGPSYRIRLVKEK
jgi:hypothetical protein